MNGYEALKNVNDYSYIDIRATMFDGEISEITHFDSKAFAKAYIDGLFNSADAIDVHVYHDYPNFEVDAIHVK